MAAIRKDPSLQPDTKVSSHNFNHPDLYMSLHASDVRWVLETYRPILSRFGYDLLYEIWLDAIEGRVTDESATAEQIKKAMAATRGLGNWGEHWTG